MARIVRGLAALLLFLGALVGLGACSTGRYESRAFVYPPAPPALDVSRCHGRRPTWAVRPTYTFRGVRYAADSALLPDSTLDLTSCESRAAR